jgi:hypothetical protein
MRKNQNKPVRLAPSAPCPKGYICEGEQAIPKGLLVASNQDAGETIGITQANPLPTYRSLTPVYSSVPRHPAVEGRH